jgi:hypothetical protein
MRDSNVNFYLTSYRKNLTSCRNVNFFCSATLCNQNFKKAHQDKKRRPRNVAGREKGERYNGSKRKKGFIQEGFCG